MKRTPFYKAVAYSFFSRPFYQEVVEFWRWRSLIYLVLLLAAGWLPLIIGGAREMHLEAKEFLRQLPEITIANGRVSVDVEQPYFIHSRNGEEVMIIDTTGEIESLDGRVAEILLTESRLIVKQNSFDTRTVDLSQWPAEEWRVTPGMATDWYRMFGSLMVPVFWGLLVAGSSLYRVIQALFYSVLGLLIMRLMRVRMSYPSILCLAMVAVTPSLVVKTLLMYLGIRFSLSWLLFFAIAMGFLTFAISSVSRSESEAMADA